MKFIEARLFAARLLLAIFIPLALAEVVENFPLLPGRPISDPLSLLLSFELLELGFERLLSIGAKSFADGVELNFGPCHAERKSLVHAPAGIL